MNRYWVVGAIGICATALAGLLGHVSLDDWDFYYRLADGVGLASSDGPWITRIVGTHRWILLVPTLFLAGVLIWGRCKPPWFAWTISLLSVLGVLLIAYSAAYLPVAKPEWWGGGRPYEIIPDRDAPPQQSPNKSE